MAGPPSSAPDEQWLLHGVAGPLAAQIIGPYTAQFAGLPVRAVCEGGLAALVSPAPRRHPLPAWARRFMPSPNTAPVLSAIAALVPFLPVAQATRFDSEDSLKEMLASRAGEIEALVSGNAMLLECEVVAGFDLKAAREDLAGSGPLADLRGEEPGERELIERSIEQSARGRRSTFLARLRKILAETALDVLSLSEPAETNLVRKRVLIRRDRRQDFARALKALAEETGPGAFLRLGAFLPPVSFRRLEISNADPAAVTAARAALGIEEVAGRTAIRVAYQRTLERNYPLATHGAARRRLSQLHALFGLLDLVAQGQVKAARGTASEIRFDPEALRTTWLLQFHEHPAEERAA